LVYDPNFPGPNHKDRVTIKITENSNSEIQQMNYYYFNALLDGSDLEGSQIWGVFPAANYTPKDPYRKHKAVTDILY
jgi:hypothetical protein